MAELTKEWLQQTIAELEEERDAVPGVVNEDAAMTLAAMKLALASIEVEPVAWLLSGGGAKNNVSFDSGNAYVDPLREVTPLYAAPPAPVSVPDAIHSQGEKSASDDYYALGWNACRAAMLQGAEPVTTAYKLPANTPCKDAPEHIWLQTAGVWPENGEFSELTWCSDNQHQDDTLYVRADVVTGNSPVIPDGWVMVPFEPTYQMCKAMGLPWESPRFPDLYKAMLAAVKK
ncbi:hypothetical protein [Enterobacter hormaechei]|jgi:hypothetical protein